MKGKNAKKDFNMSHLLNTLSENTTFEPKKTEDVIRTYPELDWIARTVGDIAITAINGITRDVQSEMPYKAQYVLEKLIELLNEKV
jgi:hypothetical protein